MRDLKLTIHAMPTSRDIEYADTVIEKAVKLADFAKAAWKDHLISQALHLLHDDHRMSPSEADRAEHARIASIIKHTEAMP